MSLLLDTHALAWWVFDDARMPVSIRALVADPEVRVAVSVVSAFECATKHRIGKWPEAVHLVRNFTGIVVEQGFELLDVTVHHALRAGTLEAKHRDPFDRLLAAQAELDGLDLVTADPSFAELGTATVW